MDDTQFDDIAERKLRAIVAAVDALDGVEAELSQGVLTVSFDQGPPFIVNSHRAAKQIWMAADRTAWHFDPVYDGVAGVDGPAWKASKPPHEDLDAALEAALGRKLGRSVRLGLV